MRIGVAIPCYIGHIDRLLVLLDSIEQQTRLPDKVVVSCSSTNFLPAFPAYKFEFEIVCEPTKKNTAQNRNIAGLRLLDTDIISFFDADDVMHPQRIEFIERAINGGADVVLHDYEDEQMSQSFDTCHILYNNLCQCESGCIRHFDWNKQNRIHHAQVTVKSCVFNNIRFDEDDAVVLKADCVFCWSVFALPNIKNAYISNKLSLYICSGTCHNFSTF
jgi:hypothetical protein